MKLRKSVVISLALLGAFALGAASPVLAFDQKGHDERIQREQATKERGARETKVQLEQDKIRKDAKDGGYEEKYDKAVKEYAGARTRESVEKSRPKDGTGHPGDHAQPGLNGREGSR